MGVDDDRAQRGHRLAQVTVFVRFKGSSGSSWTIYLADFVTRFRSSRQTARKRPSSRACSRPQPDVDNCHQIALACIARDVIQRILDATGVTPVGTYSINTLGLGECGPELAGADLMQSFSMPSHT